MSEDFDALHNISTIICCLPSRVKTNNGTPIAVVDAEEIRPEEVSTAAVATKNKSMIAIPAVAALIGIASTHAEIIFGVDLFARNFTIDPHRGTPDARYDLPLDMAGI